jgi:hypothetical protein
MKLNACGKNLIKQNRENVENFFKIRMSVLLILRKYLRKLIASLNNIFEK